MGLGRWALVLALAVAAGGCQNKTDLGTECTLVRRNPDGGEPITLTNAEVKPGQEWISDGVPSCENLVCVRDADFPTEGANPSGPAMGYCSNICSPNTGSTPTTQDACPAANPADDAEGSPNRLTCRRLSLDEETLAAFRESDPEGYRRIFGENESPYYCARGDGKAGSGGSSDAGTP